MAEGFHHGVKQAVHADQIVLTAQKRGFYRAHRTAALDFIDEVIRLIRSSRTVADSKQALAPLPERPRAAASTARWNLRQLFSKGLP